MKKLIPIAPALTIAVIGIAAGTYGIYTAKKDGSTGIAVSTMTKAEIIFGGVALFVASFMIYKKLIK